MLLVDSLYAEETEAVKSILNDVKFEAMLWNLSQPVNFSSGSESLFLT
jgi:hypothetical protein